MARDDTEDGREARSELREEGRTQGRGFSTVAATVVQDEAVETIDSFRKR